MKKKSDGLEPWELILVIAAGIIIAELAIYLIKTMHGI